VSETPPPLAGDACARPALQQLSLAVGNMTATLFDHPRKRVAVFDLLFQRSNPVGSCQRLAVSALAEDYDVTVFAAAFDPPPREGIHYVKVPAPRRPIALLYCLYQVSALARYVPFAASRLRKFDLVVSSDTIFSCAGLYYAHFCHRAFLKLRPLPIKLGSLRGWWNWLDHSVQALLEPLLFRRATAIVACSRGLAAEIVREYPFCHDKVRVIHNAVDIEHMRRPADFDRASARHSLGFEDTDIVFAFVGLGHFDRKGLPLLIDAVARTRQTRIKLLVVGGRDALLAPYRKQVGELGIDAQVAFIGNQADVRAPLWLADAFAFPSAYEAFSLVILEAAAAGLPVIAPAINGVDEVVKDGENGYIVVRSPEGVAAALLTFADLSPETRRQMGFAASRAVKDFNPDRFRRAWRDLARQMMVKKADPRPAASA
jgi:glycosyltransferase involved in cell wall biosynthesis